MKKALNSIKCFFLVVLAIGLLSGCGRTESAESKQGEEHPEEKEPVRVTAYSERSEAFIEFDEPTAGEKTRFLIHLTRLADWKPVTEGPLKLVLAQAEGSPTTYSTPAPARPGIFDVELSAPQAGDYTLKLILEGKHSGDEIIIPGVHVLARGEEQKTDRHGNGHGDHGHADQGHDHHDEEHAHGGHDHADSSVVYGTGEGNISFLKEQQWNVEFMAASPGRMDLGTYFSSMGELVPVSNAEATVSAPLAGIISAAKPLPFVGEKVAKGDVLALIEPSVQQEGGIGQLTASYAEVKNRVILAQKEYERAKRLFEAKIAPRKRVEEAQLTLDSARAALEPLEKAMKSVKGDALGGRIGVRAPLSGTVVEMDAAMGRTVEAGQPIMRIIDTGTLWLRASIPAVESDRAWEASSASFTVTGLKGEFRPSRLVTVNDMLDPKTRTLSVFFEVPNPENRFKVGMFANVAVRTGSVEEALTVPKDALVEDEGRYFVFIHSTGETFERREVKPGAQDKGYVQIKDGLKDNERVVTKGAYYVKLAATASKGMDAHGHAH